MVVTLSCDYAGGGENRPALAQRDAIDKIKPDGARTDCFGYALCIAKANGIKNVEGHRGPSTKNTEANNRQKRILNIIKEKPDWHGKDLDVWTLEAITDVYNKKYRTQLSRETIKRSIKKTGHSWGYIRSLMMVVTPRKINKLNAILSDKKLKI